MNLRIREFDPSRDREAVRSLFVELQDFERALDPRMPRGEEIADAYLDLMFRRCREFDGTILLGEEGGAVTGFITVLHFADLKRDMPGWMRRIAAFLDIPVDETRWLAEGGEPG